MEKPNTEKRKGRKQNDQVSTTKKKRNYTLGEVENTGGNSLANNQKARALLFLLLQRSQNTRASSLFRQYAHTKKKCVREEKPPWYWFT